MKKKLLACTVVLMLLSPMAYHAWEKEWFVSTPTSVIKDAFAKANSGQFEAACQSLPPWQQKQMLDDPGLVIRAWNEVTKNGTVDTVTVAKENRGITGTFGYADVSIRYRDGSILDATTIISYRNGRWTFDFAEIQKVALQTAKQAQ